MGGSFSDGGRQYRRAEKKEGGEEPLLFPIIGVIWPYFALFGLVWAWGVAGAGGISAGNGGGPNLCLLGHRTKRDTPMS